MVIRLILILLLLTGTAQADTLQIVPGGEPPVVGEMVPVTLRGEYTSTITLEKLTFPDSADYDWAQIGRDRWSEERVGGRTVRVLERQLALFPRKPGPLSVGPLVHRLTVMSGADRVPLEVVAPAVTLSVEPYPGEGSTLAASSFSLKDELSAMPGQLHDGETLVRRVTLRATGTLPHLVPVRPAMREPWLITFAAPEIREMRPTPEGPVTTVVWEWHLRPRTGEPGVLPAVEIPWFDTAARSMRIAEIPAIPFGYQSFNENRYGADRLPSAEVGKSAAAVGLGLLAGLAAAMAGLSTRRPADVTRTFRRLRLFDPTRRAVLRAARSGDLAALRAAAERYLRRRRDLGLPVSGRETEELDRALFSRDDKASAADGRRYLAAVLDHG